MLNCVLMFCLKVYKMQLHLHMHLKPLHQSINMWNCTLNPTFPYSVLHWQCTCSVLTLHECEYSIVCASTNHVILLIIFKENTHLKGTTKLMSLKENVIILSRVCGPTVTNVGFLVLMLCKTFALRYK